MGDLTKNISRHEVACRCGNCSCDTLDYETANVVQECCDFFATALGVPKVVLNVHSGHRCVAYNKRVGGAIGSQHVKGRALDISIAGVSPEMIANYLDTKYPQKYGIGTYHGFVHVDTRSGPPARWNG